MTSVEVIDLKCNDCGHIIRAEPSVIAIRKLEKCKLCYYPNGEKRSIKSLVQCAACGQVNMANSSQYCFCKAKKGYEVFYPKMKTKSDNVKDQIMIDKEIRKLGVKVRAKRYSPVLVQEAILKELQKLNAANSNQKVTDVRLDAIQ